MTKFQSSRKFKLAEISVGLCDLLIKIEYTSTNIEQEIVSNLSVITGQLWWLQLEPTTLIYLKTKNKQEYYSLKRNITNNRKTYLE